jgi:RNA-binding protein
LKAIGKPSFITHNGNIIIRSGAVPPVYAPVGTRDKKVFGKVADVIGPVNDPYVVIKPKKKGMRIAEELYLLPRKPRRKSFARTRRKKG